jgi:hypothetical protein
MKFTESLEETDWEKLSKNLQSALNIQIEENIYLENEVDELTEDLKRMEIMNHQLYGVVTYLERKLGNHSI